MSALDFAAEVAADAARPVMRTVATVYRSTMSYLTTRKRAYQMAFTSPAGQIVLEDLAKFCRAEDSCFNADPRLHAVLEGRREVWLRIQAHLNRSPTELNKMFGGLQLTGD